jgi:hypothetical protein
MPAREMDPTEATKENPANKVNDTETTPRGKSDGSARVRLTIA